MRLLRVSGSRRFSGPRLVGCLAALAVVVLMAAPLVWLVTQSLTPEDQAFRLPPEWIPSPWSTAAYHRIPGLIPFGRMALNSLEVAVVSTVGSLVVSVMAGYAFSRLPFRGHRLVFSVMLSALMVPVQMTVIPVFVIMRTFRLTDHLPSLWLPALINVFAIFFFRQYFDSIPRELDEAARIDGAGHGWILFRMIVPLSGPAIAAMAILAFETAWNNYFGPLIFLSSPERMTLPVGLVTLQAGQSGSSVVVLAGITAVVVPVLVVFLVFQRSFAASVASTGLRS